MAKRPMIIAIITGLIPDSQASAFTRPDRNARGCVTKAIRSAADNPYLVNFAAFVNIFGGIKRITKSPVFPF